LRDLLLAQNLIHCWAAERRIVVEVIPKPS
jgi:hypothetical protein